MDKQVAKCTFAVPRSLCTKLLETVTSRPDECAQLLMSLQELVSVVGLQACLDYLLFPIVLLLDAAVACRANNGAQEGHMRLNVDDKVAERGGGLLDGSPGEVSLPISTSDDHFNSQVDGSCHDVSSRSLRGVSAWYSYVLKIHLLGFYSWGAIRSYFEVRPFQLSLN